MNAAAAIADLRSYHYRSATRHGQILTGEIVAGSTDAVASALRARGEWPIEISRAVSRTSGSTRMPVRDLAVGLRVLATILDAHVPASQLMRIATPSLPQAWQSSVGAVGTALESGETLSASLHGGGVAVPTVVEGLLKAGEAAGDLPGAMRRAALLAERSAAMRSAIVDALAYPTLLLAAGCGVIGILVTVVIPRFAEVLSSLGQALPVSTRVVLGIAGWLSAGIAPGVVLAVIVGAPLSQWIRSPRGKRTVDAWLLSLPVVGPLRHSFATARVSSALGSLIDCGMPVASALPYAAVASGDLALEERLLAARSRIVEGQTVSRAFMETNALTQGATRLIGAGEAGGALSALLHHAAELEGDRATLRLKSFMRLVEPALILILGIVVCGVAIALLQAVYSVRVDRL